MRKEIPVLHLMVNNTCTNDCPLCCNKQYDVNQIPVVSVKELQESDTICLTGGAPMYDIRALSQFSHILEYDYPNIKRVFIYMNGAELYSFPNMELPGTWRIFKNFPKNRNAIYGLTISPKCIRDFNAIRDYLPAMDEWQSIRIYCFSDRDKTEAQLLYHNRYELYHDRFEIVMREWQTHFKPAPNTIFRRLPIWIS